MLLETGDLCPNVRSIQTYPTKVNSTKLHELVQDPVTYIRIEYKSREMTGRVKREQLISIRESDGGLNAHFWQSRGSPGSGPPGTRLRF